MSKRITIDPITRIEGHLRVDAEINDGKVTKAWSSGQMWRGVELILLGRDPRDAWAITQRICGVCTTVHAITSVRAVENALQLEVPLNAQYIRNMIQSAHAIHDHIVHFYHLSALDFVDVVSALKADPVKAANWIQQYSDWHLNGKEVMIATQEKLKAFVGTGQLGPFTNGYWGHPAMKLSPEINLVAVAHYLQALEVQREANKIVTILGSKTPHIQNLAVGGVSNPIAVDSQSVLTVDRLYAIKTQIDKLADFVNKVYLIDVAAIGSVYAGLDQIRRGRDELPFGAGFPDRHQGHGIHVSGRVHPRRRPRQIPGRSRASATTSSARASRNPSSTPGTPTARKARCTPTRAKRRRITPTSRTTANIPGSSRRPSMASARRSARWRRCSTRWPPAISRPPPTSPRCSTRCRRWLAPRSVSMRCTRPSAATPPAPSAAR